MNRSRQKERRPRGVSRTIKTGLEGREESRRKFFSDRRIEFVRPSGTKGNQSLLVRPETSSRSIPLLNKKVKTSIDLDRKS